MKHPGRHGRAPLLVRAAALAVVLAATPAGAHEGGHAPTLPPWQQASPWPDRVVVTFADDPARTLAVTWRTDASVEVAQAQIVRATPYARFDLGAASVVARTEALDPTKLEFAARVLDVPDNAGLPKAHYHSVIFKGLAPDTLYAYRVGAAGGKWSEWFQVRTAPTEGPIEFLYLGDAQNGILSHWARTIRAAYAKAPEARFVIHAGDLVDRGSRDFEWAQWFRAVGFIHGMIPAIPVAGNHEYAQVELEPGARQRLLSVLWRPQFTLPVEPEMPAELRETVYQVRYTRDLDVFVLDTNAPDIALQARWLDARLAASTARWKIATFHHPVFSSGRGRDNAERRSELLPVLRRHAVDLVLQGHDHTYARGTIPVQTPERVASRRGEAIESMFVNSVSGAKMYEFSKGGWDRYAKDGVRLDRQAENAQFFQRIRIDGGTLSYEAWTADGQLYDSFGIEKDAKGGKRLLRGRASTMPTIGFANSTPYVDVKGLDDK